eukprot:Em0009g528a
MHLWAKLPLNTNSSSMSLQWNASLQPDYVITAYTLHHRVPSLKSQSEMWAPPSTATVQFHTYNPSGILFYQINSVMTDILEVKLHGGLPWLMFAQCGLWTSCRWIQQYQNLQRWSVAHFPSCNLCDGQGYVVLFEQASNTFYVTVDTVHTAAITAAIVPLLTMKVYFEGFPSTSRGREGCEGSIMGSPRDFIGPPVTPAGTALQLECGVGRHQCCSQPAQVVAPGHKEHEEPLAVSIPSHHWMENYSSLGSKFSQD